MRLSNPQRHARSRPSSAPDPDAPTAFTLVETLIAAFLLGLLLLLTVQGTDYVRNQLRRQRTWELLARLNQAMDAYHAATGHWPGSSTAGSGEAVAERGSTRTGRESPAAADNDEDRATVRPELERGSTAPPVEPAWSARIEMRERQISQAAIERARRLLGELFAVPASRLILETGLPAGDVAPEMSIHDAWGRPLRCLTDRSESAVDRQAVAANGGRPIFISQGRAPPPEGATPRLGYIQRSDEVPG